MDTEADCTSIGQKHKQMRGLAADKRSAIAGNAITGIPKTP
jgi:hypothetical protein